MGKILESYKNNANITTSDIVETLMKIYDLFYLKLSDIHSDVDQTIELLFQASLLKGENELQDKF